MATVLRNKLKDGSNGSLKNAYVWRTEIFISYMLILCKCRLIESLIKFSSSMNFWTLCNIASWREKRHLRCPTLACSETFIDTGFDFITIMYACIARLVHTHRNARSFLPVIRWNERCLLYGTKYFVVSFRDAFLRTVTFFSIERFDTNDEFNFLDFARRTWFGEDVPWPQCGLR